MYGMSKMFYRALDLVVIRWAHAESTDTWQGWLRCAEWIDGCAQGTIAWGARIDDPKHGIDELWFLAGLARQRSQQVMP